MHLPSPALIRLTLFFILVAITTGINAESLESLLMPGEVIKGHEKYEQECDQ